jgi:hypothetical protein
MIRRTTQRLTSRLVVSDMVFHQITSAAGAGGLAMTPRLK